MQTNLAVAYRPQFFKDLIGQDHVTKVLQNLLRTDRIPPGYLMAGSRGSGKTTTARIYAKALNCSARSSEGEPCNTCKSCSEIDRNISMDFVEMDAASNGLVADVKRIKDQAQYASLGGRKRIWLLDESHAMSKQAFEAMLKLLEEPPPDVIFIFCIWEEEKVYTDRGWVSIKEVEPGCLIWTEKGFQKVLRRIYNGKKETFLLKTNRGTSIRLTPDHRVRVLEGDSWEWREAKDLKAGDRLPLFHSYSNLPGNDLTLDECEVLGRLVADGCWSSGLQLLFNNEEIEYGRKLLEKAGITYAERERRVFELTLHDSRSLRERFGLQPYSRETGKDLPTAVYSMGEAQFDCFLRGWIGGDGSVSSRGYRRIYSSNQRLITDLRTLLGASGIRSNLRFYPRKVKRDSDTTGVREGVYAAYQLLIGERGFSPEESELFESLSDPKVVPVYDLEVEEAHAFVVGGLSVHNCTTAPLDMPETIASRCMNFEFKRVPAPIIQARLKYICDQEGIAAEEAALARISSSVNGGVRDAISRLDQLVAYTSNKVTVEAAEEFLGLLGWTYYLRLFQAISSQDHSFLLMLLQQGIERTSSAALIVENFIDFIRTLFLIKLGQRVELTAEATSELKSVVAQFSEGSLVRMVDGLYLVLNRLSKFPSPKTLDVSFLTLMANYHGVKDELGNDKGNHFSIGGGLYKPVSDRLVGIASILGGDLVD